MWPFKKKQKCEFDEHRLPITEEIPPMSPVMTEEEKEQQDYLKRQKEREEKDSAEQLLLWEHCSRPAQDIIESLGCVPSNYIITNNGVDRGNYTINYSFQHKAIEECKFECKGSWYKVSIDGGLSWANKQEIVLIEKAANVEMKNLLDAEIKKEANQRQEQRDILMLAFDKLKEEQNGR